MKRIEGTYTIEVVFESDTAENMPRDAWQAADMLTDAWEYVEGYTDLTLTAVRRVDERFRVIEVER